jgi:acetylornithine deacetylase
MLNSLHPGSRSCRGGSLSDDRPMNAPETARNLSPRTTRRDPSSIRAGDIVGLEMIRRLIAFPTVSRDSNLALIEWVRDHVETLGATTTFTFDDDRRKANLFVTFAAQDGNATRGGIVLSGHTDVVPVDGQPWDTDPWTATVVNHRLHGRGVTDMKSFSAIGLAFVPEFLQRGLKRPLHFALSYDEEIGCIGVRRLIADVVARGIKPTGCIIGEPTGMQLVVAHKGKKAWRCRVRGHEAHSSLTPRGVNAVQVACDIVAWIGERARAYRNAERQDPAYDVPFSTPHVGVIRGGTALNIVPRDCAFEFEIRHLPFDDPDVFFADVERFAHSLVPAMKAVDPQTYIEFDHLSTLPGFDDDGRNAIADIGRECSGARGTHKVSFGSEAALFHNASMPAVICGPGHIEQAHQPNEWVSLEQLARCEDFMRRLATHLCIA